jgi:FKBP-type peptidyl-prolyl cis-trans isomerase FkpA
MKTKIALFICTAFFAISAGAQNAKPLVTKDGIQYRIITHLQGARKATANDVLRVNFRIATERRDSVILETFSMNQPRYVPVAEPTLKEALLLLSWGDSAEIFVNADTLFQKSFGNEKPRNMARGERVRFIIKVVEVLNQAEMLKKQAEQVNELKAKDSLGMVQYLSTLTGVKQTASGLRYVVTKKTEGTQAKNGDKVSMLYKGYLLNGEVFDGNMDGTRPAFDFTLGTGSVIRGWEEGVALMKEGEEFKFIIPYGMAYGEQGTGPIPPYSTLVFDVKLVKIN